METSTHNPQLSTLRPTGYSNEPEAVRSRSRREYLRKYQSKWITKRRQEWIAQNGPCIECSSDDRLEVDHVNPEDKKLNPRALWSLAPNNPRRIAELAKCQVLCHACHKAKTRPQLVETGIRKAAIRPRDESGRWYAAAGANHA